MRLYDHFGYIEQTKKIAKVLGNNMYWTIKEDGSNTAIYNKDGKWRVASRNREVAQFEYNVLQLEEVKHVIDFLNHVKNTYGSEYVVYGEYMPAGYSPTHLKEYKEASYKVFDIYDMKAGRYIEYYTMLRLVEPFDVPVVELFAVTNSKTIDHLQETKDKLLDLLNPDKKSFRLWLERKLKGITPRREEGLVGKCYDHDIFIKAKYPVVKTVKIVDDYPKILPPQLPREEVLKALYKAKDHMTPEEFRETKIAMPKIAEEVQKECKETGMINKMDLYKLYLEELALIDDYNKKYNDAD